MKRRVFYLFIMPLALAWFFVLGGTARAMEITVDTVWTKAQSPIVANGAILIRPGVKLAVEPGVVIKLKDNSFKPFPANWMLRAARPSRRL